LDRTAEPARVEAGDDPVADREPADASTKPDDFASAVAERHDLEPGRSPAAAFEHHQVAVVERNRAHPNQDFPGSGLRIVARCQRDPVNTAEALDPIGSHVPTPMPNYTASPGNSISSMTVLRLLPCTSWFSEMVTPPPSAFSITKLKARSFGNS
jgi:hypothetical protein